MPKFILQNQNNQKLDKELRALYEEKGKLPDMGHIEHKRHRKTVRILLGLIIFLAVLTAASWTGFLLFGPQGGGGGDISLNFEGPQAVISGIPQELVLRYKNLDRDPLAFTALRLRVPDNLAVQEIDPKPEDDKHYEWNFGALPAKSSGEIRLQVVPYGLDGEEIDLIAIFTYKPSNFNAEFQTSKTHTFVIQETAIDIRLSGPSQATPGQEIKLQAVLENVTDKRIEGVRAALNMPSSFSLNSTLPESNEALWELGAFEAGEKKEIEFSGRFLSTGQGTQEIAVTAEVGDKNNSSTLAQGKHAVNVESTNIEIRLTVNENPDLQWVRTGQTLNFALNLKNSGTESFDDMKAVLYLAGGLLNWSSASAQDASINAGRVAFPEEGDFNLEAGEEKELRVQIPLGGSELRAISPFIEAHGEVSYGGTTIATPVRKFVVVSDMSLASSARYFSADGTPVGSGPLPPKVGEQTAFELRFRIRNTVHDLTDIVVTAGLPEGIVWTDKKEVQAGRLSFDEEAREVRWEIPRLPVTTPEISAQFEVKTTPTEEDRGKLLLLLNVARAEARDAITQTIFSSDAPAVSSSLEADPFGRGKGVVE